MKKSIPKASYFLSFAEDAAYNVFVTMMVMIVIIVTYIILSFAKY